MFTGCGAAERLSVCLSAPIDLAVRPVSCLQVLRSQQRTNRNERCVSLVMFNVMHALDSCQLDHLCPQDAGNAQVGTKGPTNKSTLNTVMREKPLIGITGTNRGDSAHNKHVSTSQLLIRRLFVSPSNRWTGFCPVFRNSMCKQSPNACSVRF